MASLGFLPMAISTSPGAEVQRPLATVVIGGLITSTLLTLAVVPVLYHLVFAGKRRKAFGSAQARSGNGSGGMATASVIALLLIAPAAQAQTPVLTLDSAVARALRGHPAITAAELEVQQQDALRKTAFQLEPLGAQFQGGQINSAAHDYSLQAVTGLPFPTAIAQRARYLKESLRLAEADQGRVQAAVRESTASAYLQWAMSTAYAKLLQQGDSAMQQLAAFAERKFNAGATGRLEMMSARSAADRSRLAVQQAQANIAVHAAELEQWTGALNGAVPESTALRTAALQPAPAAANDPVVAAAAQQAAVAEAAWKMERGQCAPSLQGGAFLQSIDGVTPFSGYLLGASIPLPGGGQGARTKAARLQSEIAEQHLEEVRRSRSAELARTRAERDQLLRSLAYYDDAGAQLADAIRHDAERAYYAGDAGYLELLQAMDRARAIQAERLATRLQAALSVIHLNALLGQ